MGKQSTSWMISVVTDYVPRRLTRTTYVVDDKLRLLFFISRESRS